jgi:hypothetical protein
VLEFFPITCVRRGGKHVDILIHQSLADFGLDKLLRPQLLEMFPELGQAGARRIDLVQSSQILLTTRPRKFLVQLLHIRAQSVSQCCAMVRVDLLDSVHRRRGMGFKNLSCLREGGTIASHA